MFLCSWMISVLLQLSVFCQSIFGFTLICLLQQYQFISSTLLYICSQLPGFSIMPFSLFALIIASDIEPVSDSIKHLSSFLSWTFKCAGCLSPVISCCFWVFIFILSFVFPEAVHHVSVSINTSHSSLVCGEAWGTDPHFSWLHERAAITKSVGRVSKDGATLILNMTPICGHFTCMVSNQLGYSSATYTAGTWKCKSCSNKYVCKMCHKYI